jgi:dTDP-glucose pyrophosphorylase
MKKKEKIDKLYIDRNISIIDAMTYMDEIEKKLLIVTNNKKFIGLLSIGDIQRAIIANYKLTDPIYTIIRSKIKLAKTRDDFETVKNLMIQYRTEFMPVIDDNGFLQDVLFWEEIFHEQYKENIKKINIPVVIMAGGKGSRLKPFSNIFPKPLFPVGEKAMIDLIIENFFASGCNHFYISLNYKSDLIRTYLQNKYKKEIILEYIIEEEPLGTAGSLRLISDKIKSTFIISNCDILVNTNLNQAYKYHINNKNSITILSAIKKFKIPYGIIKTTHNNTLSEIHEKPEFNYCINTGVYFAEPSIFNIITNESYIDMPDVLNTTITQKKNIGVFPVSEKSWLDIGEWTEYKKTIEAINHF